MSAVEGFVNFLNESGSPHLAVNAIVKQVLEPAGVEDLHYMTRGGAIIAYRAAQNLCQPRIVILASHTDSPCLKLRPHSKLNAEGCTLLGIETYGGGLWRTFMDRGLKVGGQVVFRDNGKLKTKLVSIPRAVAYIPSLCIHLQTAEERANFKLNTEDQLRPIIGLQPEGKDEGAKEEAKEEAKGEVKGCRQADLHADASVLQAVSREIGVKEIDILAWDLCLTDAVPAGLCGINKEFIEAPGLDNKYSMYCNFKSLVNAAPPPANTLYVAIAFNHEEIGSRTPEGADSCLLHDWLLDIFSKYGKTECDLRASMKKSVLLSCDVAHAVHPNYANKHQSAHKPFLGGGVAIKTNANQRYATTALGNAFVRSLGDLLDYQELEVRNDSPCGSTIGPMTSALMGIETIDCGSPILAMHAARELAAAKDVDNMILFGRLVLEHWESELDD